MENSPTESTVNEVSLANELTNLNTETSAEQTQEQSSDVEQNQVATDNVQPTEKTHASPDSNESANDLDDESGLAKFAKAQGFDLAGADDNLKRAIKMAHDNQKAYRQLTSNKEDVVLSSQQEPDTKNIELESKINNLEYQQMTDKFWADGHDKSLESEMVNILQAKREKFGDGYAAALGKDLESLYLMAQQQKGLLNPVDVDAIRKEERESIKKQLTASSVQAQATESKPQSAPIITDEWIKNVYDPKNPEHIKLMEQAGLR